MKNGGWLSDQIIAFYFLYFEHEKYQSIAHRVLLVSPQVTQWMKLGTEEDLKSFLIELNFASKDFIFFAVNDNQSGNIGGTHWNLLVFSRLSNTFYDFDSLNDFNRYATLQLVENLKISLGCSQAEYVPHWNLQQLNGYDCGIHLLCNTENVIRQIMCDGDLRKVGQIDECQVTKMREHILNLIKCLIEQNLRQNFS